MIRYGERKINKGLRRAEMKTIAVRQKRSYKFYVLVLLGLFISMSGIILAFSKYFFNSDSAFFSLLAVEQIKSGKLFPPGMNYSTVNFVRTPNLVMIPFILLTGDLMLSRELAVITLWILIVLAVFWAFCPKRERNFTGAVLSLSLLTIPYLMKYSSEWQETTDQLFFQAAYLLFLFDIALALGFAHRILLLRKEDGVGRKLILYPFFVVIILLSLVNSIREDLIVWIPLAAAFLLFYYLETGKSLPGMLRTKRCLFTVLVIGISMVVGYLLCRYVSVTYWNGGMASSMNFVDGYSLGEKIARFIGRLTLFFGSSGTPRLISLAGLYRAVNDCYAILLIWIIPILSLAKYRKFRSSFTRFVVLFSWISNFAIAYFAVSTGELTPRYYMSIYLLDELLLGAVFTEWAQRRDRGTAYLVGLVFLLYACFCHACFWHIYSDHIGENPSEGLLSFLEEKDLDYGYASYWNSFNNMVLSNEQITILSMGDHEHFDPDRDPDSDKMSPYYPTVTQWLNNSNWYDVEQHPGRCFILLEQDDSLYEELEEKYYSLQPEEFTFTDEEQGKTYTILVFESNEALWSLE